MITFDQSICADFEAASSREWLETNGIGGFASGTISGANTRRYHGLFTPATDPPLGRITMLSKLEETVVIGEDAFELSSNQYPGRVHPQGLSVSQVVQARSVSGVDFCSRWRRDREKDLHDPRLERGRVHVGSEADRSRRPTSDRARCATAHILRRLPSSSTRDRDFQTDYDETGNTVSMRPVAEMPPIYFRHTGASDRANGILVSRFRIRDRTRARVRLHAKISFSRSYSNSTISNARRSYGFDRSVQSDSIRPNSSGRR